MEMKEEWGWWGFDEEMNREGERKELVFGVGVKGEGKWVWDEIFCEMVMREGVIADQS